VGRAAHDGSATTGRLPGCPSGAAAATGRDAPGGAAFSPERAEARGPDHAHPVGTGGPAFRGGGRR